jgi:ABC-2 type transport system ATP-binding protein
MDEVKHLADRAAVLVAGRVVAEGRPDTLGRPELAVESTVRFRYPPHGLEGLPDAVRRLCSTQGVDVVIHTAEPTQVLWVLIGWARARNQDLVDVTVERPSLEDLYLRLTAQEEAPR